MSVRTACHDNSEFAVTAEESNVRAAVHAPPFTSDGDTLLRIVESTTYLHSRPMEFFLSNSTEHNRIGLGLTYDGNVYRREDVEEFVEECRQATLDYLGEQKMVKGKL